jgi:hypothetical protein
MQKLCSLHSAIQEQLFSWWKLALGWHCEGLPIGVSTYQKHTPSGYKAVSDKSCKHLCCHQRPQNMVLP